MSIAARHDQARAFPGSSRVAATRSCIAPAKSWLYCLSIARMTSASSGGAGWLHQGLSAASEASASAQKQSVAVPMMDVRIMLMAVRHGDVAVRVGMRLGAVPGEIVLVAMVLVVCVRVLVLQDLVPVRVPVALGEVQRDAGGDQRRSGPEERIGRLAEQ